MWWIVAAWAASGQVEGSFDGIRVAAGCTIEVVHGERSPVQWRYESVDEGVLVVSVQEGTLEVLGRGGITDCTVEVHSPAVRRIAVSSGGQVHADRLVGALIEVVALGGTTVDIDAIEAERVHLNVVGGAVVGVSGRAQFLKAEVSGGSVLQAVDLRADAVRIRAMVGSTADVHAVYTLDAQAQGASRVTVHGRPHRRSARAEAGSRVTSD